MSTQYTLCKVSHVATGTHKLGHSDKVDTVPTGRDYVCLFYYTLKHPVKLCCRIYVFSAIIIFHALCSTVHSTWALRMKVKEVGAKAAWAASWHWRHWSLSFTHRTPAINLQTVCHGASSQRLLCRITQGRWTASFPAHASDFGCSTLPGALWSLL